MSREDAETVRRAFEAGTGGLTEEGAMAKSATDELVKYLKQAHAMEKQSALLLERGSDIAGDTEIAAIYRAHLLQTQEHARYVDERLRAHGESPSKVRDIAMQAGALGIGLAAQAAPDTPVRP